MSAALGSGCMRQKKSGKYKTVRQTIVLDGIEMTVTKKKMKNLYIRVLPPDGTVRISAPLQMDDETIDRFAMSRLEWIRRQKSRLQQADVPVSYDSGEIHNLWGEPYILEVRSGGRGSVRTEENRIVLTAPAESTAEDREKICREWYRRELNKKVCSLREKCEGIVGEQANEWRTRYMRTRWGTCNVQKRRIWLSLELAEKPVQCLEYVMLHELTHLLERRHNTRFWKFMDRFCPEWRTIRARLNQREGRGWPGES